MPIADPDGANYWLTCFTLNPAEHTITRDVLLAALENVDIEARPLWKPLHLQPIYKNKVCFGGELAADLFERGICLPSGSGMSGDERQRVIDTIRAIFRRGTGNA